jgi:hypothetical protein
MKISSVSEVLDSLELVGTVPFLELVIDGRYTRRQGLTFGLKKCESIPDAFWIRIGKDSSFHQTDWDSKEPKWHLLYTIHTLNYRRIILEAS